jgi:hypothetical protein
MGVQPSLSLVELLESLRSFGKSTARQAPLSNSGGKASIQCYEEFGMQQVKDMDSRDEERHISAIYRLQKKSSSANVPEPRPHRESSGW